MNKLLKKTSLSVAVTAGLAMSVSMSMAQASELKMMTGPKVVRGTPSAEPFRTSFSPRFPVLKFRCSPALAFQM